MGSKRAEIDGPGRRVIARMDDFIWADDDADDDNKEDGNEENDRAYFRYVTVSSAKF